MLREGKECAETDEVKLFLIVEVGWTRESDEEKGKVGEGSLISAENLPQCGVSGKSFWQTRRAGINIIKHRGNKPPFATDASVDLCTDNKPQASQVSSFSFRKRSNLVLSFHFHPIN